MICSPPSVCKKLRPWWTPANARGHQGMCLLLVDIHIYAPHVRRDNLRWSLLYSYLFSHRVMEKIQTCVFNFSLVHRVTSASFVSDITDVYYNQEGFSSLFIQLFMHWPIYWFQMFPFIHSIDVQRYVTVARFYENSWLRAQTNLQYCMFIWSLNQSFDGNVQLCPTADFQISSFHFHFLSNILATVAMFYSILFILTIVLKTPVWRWLGHDSSRVVPS